MNASAAAAVATTADDSADSEAEAEASVSCVGRGFVSIAQVPDLHRLTSVRRLCLHGNNITRIEGLQGLTALVELNLSSNAVAVVDPGSLRGLSRLTSLNLASNRLTAVAGLDGLSSLEHLNLSFNYISSLAGLSALQGPIFRLRTLNIKHNQLHNLQAFSVLVGCMGLRWLQLAGNPVCTLPNYAQALASVLSHVAQLDGVSSAEALAAPYDVAAAQQYAAARLQSFDPAAALTSPTMMTTAAGTPARHQQQQQQHHYAQVGSAAPGFQQQQGYAQPPNQPQQFAAAADAGPTGHDGAASIHPGAQPQHGRPSANRQPHRGPRGNGEAGSGDTGADLLDPGQGQGQEVGGMASMSSAANTDIRQPVDQQRQQVQGQTPGQQSQQQQAVVVAAARVVKVLVSEAAVQTSEFTPLVRRLTAEAAELRQQLATMTDELARRNTAEESLRVAMQEAIGAAQEDAHRKVEDGFREASFAVSKALQELESARHAASEAQQRVTAHVRGEEEQRTRCGGLEKDVSRLRDDLQRLNRQLLEQQHAASTALEEERRRCAGVEAAAREQAGAAAAAAAAAELAMVRAAAAAAEAKVGGLEAALSQSSTVTVSMTAKIAQTMADANAQIDLLKARLATAEQQLVDYQRREVDARAEINSLTAALTAARTQHDREMQAAARQHEEAVRAAVDKERPAAEERGKAMVALQAQQERAGLQEQVAFLKVQLQFALKESDKEQLVAQQALRSTHMEVSELRAALQAAAAKQREAESLVTDFTSVVQQQKAAIQGLQRDKEALAGRLKACGPDAFEALAAENLAFKRGAAERDMYREQADDLRRRWQEAERRVTDLQVSSSRSAEELGSKLRSCEVALAAAREEAARAEVAAERLRQEVAAQQDIVKIKVAMLDSANDTIQSLKAELGDLQVEVEEARRGAEEAEAALAREQQQREEEEEDAGEKAQLRQEAQAAEAAAVSARNALGEAQSRLRELEGRLRTASDAVADKDRMIKYVEEEVDRVKGLFEKREQRIRDERDAARADATAAAEACAAAEARLAEAGARMDRLARELEHVRGQLDDAATQLEEQRRVTAEAGEVAAARGAEAARLAARVAEVEGEMRGLLEAVERQKASSTVKMRQLASLLQDL